MTTDSKWSPEIKVGLFVLMVLLLLGYMSFQLGGFSWFKPREVKVYARFKSVSGLAEGSRVQVAGVRVGRVSTINLVDHQAEVELSLKPGLSLKEDAKVSILTRGVVGERYVDLDPGSAGAPSLAPGGTITHTESPVGIEETVGKFTGLLDELHIVLADVKIFSHSLSQAAGTKEGEAGLKNMLANLGKTSEDFHNLIQGLEQGRGTLGKMIKEEELYKEVKVLLREIKTSVAQLSSFTTQLARNEGTLGKLATDTGLYQQLQQAVAHLKNVSQKIDQAEGTMGKLVNDKSLYDNAQKTLKNLNQALEDIKGQKPSTLIGILASKVLR